LGFTGIDKAGTFSYVAPICRSAEAKEMQVHQARLISKLLLGLALTCGSCLPMWGQNETPPVDNPAPNASPSKVSSVGGIGRPESLVPFRNYSMPELTLGYLSGQTNSGDVNFRRATWTYAPNTIEKMESAFYCNDTPFVDQVRLPLATFWSGRVKLIGFESDVTTANFVLGLPGQGSLHTLSAFGNAFIATHTPPSDQLAGIHVTISFRPTDTSAEENSGRRGIEYLVRASRGFLPFLSARPESITFSSR
jgi:hypothetical protein